MITAIDIAWAAGFIEGEGCFGAYSNSGVSLTVPQVQREPLERLQRLFGGNIRQASHTNTGKPLHRWGVFGMPAAAATMTVFSLLSPRRKDQAMALLDKWKSAPGHKNLQKTHCPKGHEYTAENTYRRTKNPEWRTCRACTLDAVRLRKISVITNT
jgi:hypothetical protein